MENVIFCIYRTGRIARLGPEEMYPGFEEKIAWYADTFPELNFFYADPKKVRSR